MIDELQRFPDEQVSFQEAAEEVSAPQYDYVPRGLQWLLDSWQA